ncbi:MAG: LysR family transcriptional regulator [Verrucomicrobiales bacterium]
MFQNLFSRSGFSMERLASFCAVADAGSIARVADKDPTRQSLISRQIRELETFFGVELVRRKGRGLELTEAGRELAAVGRENFKGLADFAARCEGAPWTVRMVASNSVAYWLVLPRLKRLEKACPKIRFEIYHEQTREIVTTTREGTYDIAFVHEDALDSGWKKTVLGSVGHSVLVPKSLRRKAPMDLTGLVRVPMALPIGGRMRSLMDDLAAKAGITLQVAVGCSSYLQSAQLLESGMCATVLPDLALASLEAARFHRFPVPYRYRLCLAWSARAADTRPALARLIAQCGTAMAI